MRQLKALGLVVVVNSSCDGGSGDKELALMRTVPVLEDLSSSVVKRLLKLSYLNYEC